MLMDVSKYPLYLDVIVLQKGKEI